jgi:4-amino-4-deoxy-L-arabinose transferase-like glycosyltransferase
MRPRLPTAETWLVLLAFSPLLVGAGNEIQEFDPAQYAEVGRRMSLSGDWAHLRDNFGPFLNKGPFTFWLMWGAFTLFGLTSFAVRFPSILMGAVLLLATARIGALLWERRTGLWAAALLAASPAFQLMAADPKVDMVVSACMAAAVWLLLEARRRPWAAELGWMAAALAVLTKGPIGLAAPAVAVAPEALRRRWGAAAGEPDGSLWARLRPLRPITGPLVFLAVLLPWYLEQAREFGADGPRFLLWEQSFGRLVGRALRNDTGPLFFVHTALWAYLPFSAILAAELVRRARAFWKGGFRLPPDEGRVALWWLVIPFAAISLSSFKLPQYCYWMAPAGALLSARALLQGALPARPLALAQEVIAGLVLLLSALILALVFPPGRPALAAGWLLGMAGLTAAGLWLGRRAEAATRPMLVGVLSLTAFQLFFHGHVHRSLLEFQPDREFGLLARTLDPQGTVLPFVGAPATHSAAFYARRDTVDVPPEALLPLLAEGRTRVAVVSRDRLPDLLAHGLQAEVVLELPSFHTSRPTGRFLRAATRPEVVQHYALVTLRPPP